MKHINIFSIGVLVLIFMSFSSAKKSVTIYLIGDSTMADYTGDYDKDKDYMTTRYPVTGWGQVFQPFFVEDSLSQLWQLIRADQVVVDDRARGGRSTRTFFQEGRWRSVYDELQKDDLVLMQFGHNDAATNKTERYVDVGGYKEFLRLFVMQTLQKGGIPIILTPVNRNYPWEGDQLTSCHGDYYQAGIDVAMELKVPYIDLTQLSIELFMKMGKEYVTNHYFMNLPPGKYQAYPDGQKDNTHFQPEGAEAVAQLVFDALKTTEFHKSKRK